MISYIETNWKHEEGYDIHRYPVTFGKIQASQTINEQTQEREEKLSLVLFFKYKERAPYLKLCRLLKENDKFFQYGEDKKFHVTLLGFPVIMEKDYEMFREKIQQFIKAEQDERKSIKFDMVRLGTKYENNKTLIPIDGISNGTVVAIGNNHQCKNFAHYGNKLCSFLLQDEKLRSILGVGFRRKFPTVSCTLGYYCKDFRVTDDLEIIFDEYRHLENNDYDYKISFSELELGKSKYRDHRDWKSIQKF